MSKLKRILLPNTLNPDEAFRQLLFVHQSIRDSVWSKEEIVENLNRLVSVLLTSGFRQIPGKLGGLVRDFSASRINRLELAERLRQLPREISAESLSDKELSGRIQATGGLRHGVGKATKRRSVRLRVG